MSFGFSIGDFITVIELASKVRKEFVDAPSQFNAISDEVRSLSIVLQDIEVVLSGRELHNEQKAELKEIANGCGNVLNELEHTLEKYDEVKLGCESVTKKVKRVWKRLKWEPEDIKQLRSRIGTNIGLLNAFTSRLTQDNVVTLVRHQEDQRRQTVLDWITPIDYASQQSDFISRRQAGTGQWLLDSVEFKAWLQTGKQTLFCPGIPGAGKTIITSIVVEELNTRFQNDSSVGIAYLYCNFRRQHEQKLENLLASVLKQFVQEQPSVLDRVMTLYDRHKDKRTRPSLDEISRALYYVTSLYSRAFIIVDALDECQVNNECRALFLSELSYLQVQCGANIFMTSRFDPEITEKFDRIISLEIRASDEDMLRYINERMPSLLRTRISKHADFQSTIRDALLKAVDGMFLLAQLHMDSLKSKLTLGDIKIALKNLPKGSQGLNETYKQAMNRIEGQEPDSERLAKQALCWIIHAKRPLRGPELQHALGTRTGTSELDDDFLPELDDIVSVCAGLVTVDKESNTIRLVHYTVHEYFKRTQKDWFPNAEIYITRICATYLSFSIFEIGFCQTDNEFKERLQSNQLYDYAALNWGHHARDALTLCQEVIDFLECKAKVQASSQALMAFKHYYSSGSNYSQHVPTRITGMYLAAYFGIYEAVSSLLRHKESVDSNDSYGRTPLSWAAQNGHAAVVKLLLDSGNVDVDSKANSQNNTGLTPLLYAAEEGHETVVRLLLEKGAQLELKVKDGRTPLSCVAQYGHEAILKLLLEKGAELESKNEYGQTPLSYAASRGHVAIVQLLLDTGKVNVDSKDSGSRTPLSYAASRGHVAIVQLLLDTGKVNVDSKDSISRTPLSYAAERGHMAVVQLLHNTGKVDIDSKDSVGRSPLLFAVANRKEAVVTFLLGTGKVNIDVKDKYGRTPLLWAAEKGYQELFEQLRKRGADTKVLPLDRYELLTLTLSRVQVKGKWFYIKAER